MKDKTCSPSLNLKLFSVPSNLPNVGTFLITKVYLINWEPWCQNRRGDSLTSGQILILLCHLPQGLSNKTGIPHFCPLLHKCNRAVEVSSGRLLEGPGNDPVSQNLCHCPPLLLAVSLSLSACLSLQVACNLLHLIHALYCSPPPDCNTQSGSRCFIVFFFTFIQEHFMLSVSALKSRCMKCEFLNICLPSNSNDVANPPLE